MLVIMKKGSSEEELEGLMRKLAQSGMTGHLSRGVERTVVGVVGQTYPELRDTLELLPGIEEVIPISKPYKLSSREFQPDNTVIRVGDVEIGTDQLTIMAGPCAVESETQLLETAKAVKAAGANILRGGAFKPSTSPYAFRGLGKLGLELLAMARSETGLPFVTARSSWWRDTPTYSRSERATCRTSCFSMRSGRPRCRSCSSAACPPPFRNGCYLPSTFLPRATGR
jgi:3-deoxy-7-phosphoheptulonate synthase